MYTNLFCSLRCLYLYHYALRSSGLRRVHRQKESKRAEKKQHFVAADCCCFLFCFVFCLCVCVCFFVFALRFDNFFLTVGVGLCFQKLLATATKNKAIKTAKRQQ